VQVLFIDDERDLIIALLAGMNGASAQHVGCNFRPLRVILGLRWVLSDRMFDWIWGKVMGIPATVGTRP
jgi:hypothetical protein